MAHQRRPAISSQPLVGVLAEKTCNLGLQQRVRTIAQNLGQQIAESPWLGELDHTILGHGVSLLWWTSGGFEHSHDTPSYPLRTRYHFTLRITLLAIRDRITTCTKRLSLRFSCRRLRHRGIRLGRIFD
jgi:hypothetical protein